MCPFFIWLIRGDISFVCVIYIQFGCSTIGSFHYGISKTRCRCRHEPSTRPCQVATLLLTRLATANMTSLGNNNSRVAYPIASEGSQKETSLIETSLEERRALDHTRKLKKKLMSAIINPSQPGQTRTALPSGILKHEALSHRAVLRVRHGAADRPPLSRREEDGVAAGRVVDVMWRRRGC